MEKPMNIDSRAGRRVVVSLALAALTGCGGGSPTDGGGGGGGGGGGFVTPTPTPTPSTTVACTTPPLNPLPNPAPTTAYIDSSPTGLCLRSGVEQRVRFTNRADGVALDFTGFSIVEVVGSGQFSITNNSCNRLNGRTLFPQAECVIDVQAVCSAASSTARLRVESTARNAARYDVPLTCNP
jgi:hypothetical protein